MPEWIGALLTAIAGGILVIVGNLIVNAVRRNRSDPPTWPEMWERLDKQERRIEALERELSGERAARSEERRTVGSILTTLLTQWPQEKLPEFQDYELAYMEDTLPGPLFRKLRARRV